MTARLLIVGVDGADGAMLDRCSADGSLPRLAALRARGGSSRLSAPPGITDDALWASFQYAAGAGEHGRYYFHLPKANGRLGMAHERERQRLTFWDALSTEGARVAIIDVPKCRAPRRLNGVHLVDWLAHGRYFAKPRSHPRAFAADVVARFGAAPPSQCGADDLPALGERDVAATMRNLRLSVAKKRAASLHYLAAEPWDLVVVGFKAAHCASHAFWDFDAGHPAHDAARVARHGDPIMTVLRDIDAAIGDLVEAAGPTAEVLVFSPTDFQPNGSLVHLMPEIAERLNARLAPVASDWRCSILPYNENCTALRVSHRRRSWFGAGPDDAPGAELLQAIEAELHALRDAETGRPVVSAITRPSLDWPGSRARQSPDVLALWTSGLVPAAVVSASLGRIEAPRPRLRPGNHVAGGFVVGAGALAAGVVRELSTLADVGPLARSILRGATAAPGTGPATSGAGERPGALPSATS